MFTSNMLMSHGDSNILATDFSEYTLNAFPSDWTNRWSTNGTFEVRSTPTVIGGRSFLIDGTIEARRLASWDALGTPGDCEVLALVRNGSTINGSHSAVSVRASGATLSAQSCYQVTMNYGGGVGEVHLSRITNNSPALLDFFNLSWGSTAWYWVRLSAIGNNIRAKVWLQTGTEPSSWQLEATDSAHSSGWAGVGSFHRGGKNFDYFAASLDGSTVPLP